ncbi:MAG: AAA family ATPase [Alphaproteobacteria bacterium]|nr:AAA family ATPase [Alphaproteobacteria bacterium]
MTEKARDKSFWNENTAALKGKKIIAVIAGREGIGKTWFAIALAQALSLFKQKVLLFDADNGLSNTKVQLGLDFISDLDTVIYGTKSLNQIIFSYGKGGFDIITGNPSSSGLMTMSVGRLQILGDDLDIISSGYDKTILDISSGLSDTTKVLSGLAQEVIILCSDDPRQQFENYEIIRHIAKHCPKTKINLVINRVNDIIDGQRIYEMVKQACQTNLSAEINLLGIIRNDTRVRDSIRNQVPLLARYPQSEAALDVVATAKRLIDHG